MPPATTAAEELRTAAAKLTALLDALDDRGPWHTEPCASTERAPCIVAYGRTSDQGPPTALHYVADAETPEHAAYLAALHPGTGRALAKWLESWTGVDFNEHAAMGDLAYALDLARQINRATGKQP